MTKRGGASATGPIVVDPSALASTVLRDEDYEHAPQLVADIVARGATTSSLFWYEIRSLLFNAERRGRIDEGGVDLGLRDLRGLGLSIAPEAGDDAVLRTVRQFELTPYDACYALLAIQTNGRLATLDKALIRAASAGAFDLWSPTSTPPT